MEPVLRRDERATFGGDGIVAWRQLERFLLQLARDLWRPSRACALGGVVELDGNFFILIHGRERTVTGTLLDVLEPHRQLAMGFSSFLRGGRLVHGTRIGGA